MFRKIDGSNDWEFGKGFSNYATNSEEVALNIQTRVLSFYRDCFFDLEAGIDYFNLLDYNKQRELEMAIENTIITTDGVVELRTINLFLNADRNLTLEYNVLDIYSNTISNELILDK